MNRYTIPAILTVTVLLAGMFAFMPVEQASTVHDTIQASSIQIQTVDSTPASFAIADDDEMRISSTDAYLVLGIECTFADTDNSVSDATPGPVITVDGAIATPGFNLADPGVTSTDRYLTDVSDYVSEGGADSLVFDWGAITGENADETIDCTVAFLASGDDTITAAWIAFE